MKNVLMIFSNYRTGEKMHPIISIIGKYYKLDAYFFGEMHPVAGAGGAVFSVLFTVFLTFLEILVAIIQAYVFTLLSALYFGMATEEHH